ncbi:NAD(P)H-dependent oxidoreductase [Runella sp. MFBS21]|uniref:NAD(P)H-dependent oxidoreductase n=1 Tax=Runella sp. MFBS21 TaxID=3034018 RepID=UPI0023F67167|nr:NAD(P)H-dependent oxidoreductase [Runella sp. MFBS21]MDF7820139.1 NAD(P)H-dependent oxidoreductase [Runella sp. MFBS21]
MKLLEDLNWRYATKKMNGEKVSQEKIDFILEAIRLSPSSSGLQPYEILVVSNPELKEKIRPIAFGQSQITDASHLLIFASWEQYTEERINAYFERANRERGLPDSATDAYRTRLIQMTTSQTPEQNFAHTAKQAAIALGIAIVAAANQKVDTTPMEGFDAKQLDALLGLSEKGLKSTAILALGYRDESGDWLAKLKKVRTPKELLYTHLN